MCLSEAGDKLSMSLAAGGGDQLPMCLGDADDKLAMSLAAGSGDQHPMCLGDADDKLSISLAAGGGGDRFSFLTVKEYHSELYGSCTLEILQRQL